MPAPSATLGADAPADAGANYLLFAVMSLIWGSTWIAAKAGVTATPPLFFATARFVLAVACLLLFVRGYAAAFAPATRARVVVSALLVNAGTYGLLFWGMQTVASGVAGLVNLALIPVGLLGLSVLAGEEKPGWRHALALLLGSAGLVLVFWRNASFGGGRAEWLGVLAIVGGTFCYCLGAVLSRPLLRTLQPLQLTTAQALVGVVALAALSATFETVTAATLQALFTPRLLASLLAVSLLGTIVGYSIYLRLLRVWGAFRAGLYAFVSPVVALAAGALVFGESIGWRELAGAATMLAGAAVAMRRPEVAAPARDG
ncbi:MAG: DMT family transporter [Burkholderiales bacterium]|nr:DMT family transporter [Burkholderiales bacterium]